MSVVRKLMVATGLGLALVAGAARPAAADPARPGNVRSTITGVTPTAPITAHVQGGDSFLEVSVERGHDAVVADYEGFPYVRYAPDGKVYENHHSKAYFQNKTRGATSNGPDSLDPAGAPDWHQVADDGTYAWHDHRIHWMSPTRAPVHDWTVPLTVDGVAVSITGRYEPVDAPPAWPWWLATAAVAGAVGWLARRRHRTGALAVGVAAAWAAPVVAGLILLPAASWVLGSLVFAALAGAVVGAVLRGPSGAAVVAGAGVAIGLWGLRRTDVFGHAVLVTSLPGWIDRSAVALAVGVGIGIVGATVWAFTRPVEADAVPAADVTTTAP